MIRQEELVIEARDGFKLAATRYMPAARSGNVAIISSATGVKRKFYAALARYLAGLGWITITYDYRGIGDSRPATLNKFRAFMHQWGELDLAGVIDWVSAEYPEAQIVAVGHSVGGQVMGLAHNNERISAMLLVASQSGYWGLWPISTRFLIWIFWYAIVPIATILFSFFPARKLGMGEDLPAGVALEWASWGRDSKYLLGRNKRASAVNFENFRAPILSVSVERDFLAPAAAVDALARFYSNAEVVRRHVSPTEAAAKKFGHFDFFRPSSRQHLWPVYCEWLNQMTREQNERNDRD